AAATNAAALRSLATSRRRNSARAGAPHSRRQARPASASRSPITTLPPAPITAWAMPRPMPWAPPVTRTTRSCSGAGFQGWMGGMDGMGWLRPGPAVSPRPRAGDAGATAAAPAPGSSCVVVREQPAPALVAELAQGRVVALHDHVRFRVGGHRAADAVLPPQVQDRVGRAVGVVLDVVRAAVGELVIRMEAGHLQHAVQLLRFLQCFGLV